MFEQIEKELNELASPEKAKNSAWFFKTGPGQYGEGDRFIGIAVPVQRKVAHKYYRQTKLGDIRLLLKSPIHEFRLAALLILVEKFKKAESSAKQEIYRFYMDNLDFVNNWDLVDSSAPYIAGPIITRSEALNLARSESIWRKRVAMLACFYQIKKCETDLAFEVASMLKNDTHDLLHKAVGWMIREVGNYCGQDKLVDWLMANDYKTLPRTLLRYAIEKFPEERRKDFLLGKV